MKYIKTFENLFDKIEKLPAGSMWKYVYAFNGELKYLDNIDSDQTVYVNAIVYGITENDWNRFCRERALDVDKKFELEAHLEGDQNSYDGYYIENEKNELQSELRIGGIGKFLGHAKVLVDPDGYHESNFLPKITGHDL